MERIHHMSETSENKHQKTVLILEDEPDVMTYLETLLQDHGYRTLRAANGREGAERLKTEKPDLVSLDITMPEQSGIRFYRDLKENPETSGIPVVVVTAVTGYGGDPEPFERFLSTRKQVPPPEAFLSKPIDRDEFIRVISELIG
jgi:CheY-like chemotaxis protein